MNGFASHGLDEDAFGEKRGNIVQAFDAFRMISPPILSQILLPSRDCIWLYKKYNWIEEHELTHSQPRQSPNM